jgi:hypothetical protein
MKNHTTPHKQVPNGWRLATLAEMQDLPHANILTLNRRGAQWEGAGYASGACLSPECIEQFWYAVREDAIVPKSTIPDSGARTNFDTGAVRDAAEGKGLYSRIPPIALRKLAKRFEDGAIKYPDGDKGPNWMQGIPLSRFYDAIHRHSTQAAEFDTSEDHLGAVLWNAAAWAWTESEINEGRLPESLNNLPFHPNGPVARGRKAERK